MLTHRRPRPTRSSTRSRRWRAATSSTTTPRCGRRSSARAPAGRASACSAAGAFWGGEPHALGRRGQRAPAGAAHARPLRPPHRRGRVPPGVARADARAASSTGCTRCRGATDAAGRARRARRDATSARAQAEAGFGCPISMTYAAVPALRTQPDARRRVGAAADRHDYDPELARRREGRRAVRHGDDREAGRLRRARQHHARAEPAATAGTSSPATSGSARRRCATSSSCSRRPPSGVACFALPRVLPDGARNAASSSSGSRTSSATARTPRARSSSAARSARLVGEEGRGVPTIIEMVNHTRLDCVLGTAAGMRAAVAEATWHAAPPQRVRRARWPTSR